MKTLALVAAALLAGCASAPPSPQDVDANHRAASTRLCVGIGEGPAFGTRAECERRALDWLRSDYPARLVPLDVVNRLAGFYQECRTRGWAPGTRETFECGQQLAEQSDRRRQAIAAGLNAAAHSLSAAPVYVAPPSPPVAAPARIAPFSCQNFGGIVRCY